MSVESNRCISQTASINQIKATKANQTSNRQLVSCQCTDASCHDQSKVLEHVQGPEPCTNAYFRD